MKDKWSSGMPETRCGAGSTLTNTANIRSALPGLIGDLHIESVLDAPCGDCNWIAGLDLPNYMGLDRSPTNLALAREKLPDGEFYLLDIVENPLPHADLVLCRDFLQHLPDAAVFRVILNVIESGSRYLLATSHWNETNSEISGGYRPLNLHKPPFSFPKAKLYIDDVGRDLALWRVAELNVDRHYGSHSCDVVCHG